jgi:hypothetical protein
LAGAAAAAALLARNQQAKLYVKTISRAMVTPPMIRMVA